MLLTVPTLLQLLHYFVVTFELLLKRLDLFSFGYFLRRLQYLFLILLVFQHPNLIVQMWHIASKGRILLLNSPINLF